MRQRMLLRVGIVGDIWAIASGLDAKRDRLAEGRQADRDRIAGLFEAIADTLSRVVVDVRRDEVPHGACQEMRAYADRFPLVAGPVLGAEADHMGELLERAAGVEELLWELKDVPDPAAELTKLERAGGRFRAEAALLRAGG